MRSTLSKILHKPKIVVPVVAVAAVVAGVIGYKVVGRAPQVSLPENEVVSIQTSTQPTEGAYSVDLAFPKTGRVAEVNAALGTEVKKGDVLASLDAGDAKGAVTQAKGALDLAKAQYASLDVQYANVKKQQDVLVMNARNTLLSSGLQAIASKTDKIGVTNLLTGNDQIPTISGTYNCDQEGSYVVRPYISGSANSGYAFTYSGLESGHSDITFFTAQPLGMCGLFIQFPSGYSSTDVNWIIEIPNSRSANYVANKNAYDLAVATRDQVLKQYEANLGQNGSQAAATAQAAIDAAQGSYEAALGAYNNNLIISPIDGVVTSIDSDLKVGQSVIANKGVITVVAK